MESSGNIEEKQPPRRSNPIGLAVDTGAGTVDDLRDACQAIEAAVDRATTPLHGLEHPLPQLTLGNWESASEQAWHALTLVYSGLAEARQLNGVRPASVADVLDGLRSARRDAERASAGVAQVRWRLAAAEDRIRRDDDTATARVAANQWRAAIRRLDLVTARLAIGIRAINRYADALTGDSESDDSTAEKVGRARMAGLLSVFRTPMAEIATGARAAGALVLVAHPWGGWRGFWARFQNESRKENQRRWHRLQKLY